MLYTPLLPGAASGSLEPRHVVVPLREELKWAELRMGSVTGADPDRNEISIRTVDGRDERLHYDQLVVALGSVSRVLPVPGLAEHGVGFRGLADAIAIRNRAVWNLEVAESLPDPEQRAGIPDLRLRGRRIRGGGGHRRGAGLRDRPHRPLSPLPHRGRPLRAGGGPRPDHARDPAKPGRIRHARAAAPGHGDPHRHAARVDRGGRVHAHRRRAHPHPHGLLDHRGQALSGAPAARPADRRAHRPDPRGAPPRGWRATRTSGRWAIPPPCPTRPSAARRPRPPTAQHALRQGKVAADNVAATLSGGQDAPLPLPHARGVRGHGPPQGRGHDAGRAAARLPGLVRGAHLPPGRHARRGPPPASGDRLDRGPVLRPGVGRPRAAGPSAASPPAHGRAGRARRPR